MKISCLLVSHNKPDYVMNAVNSVLDQYHQDWELVIMDSGVLYEKGFWDNPLEKCKVYHSNETESLRKTKAMAPWCFNECFRRDLVSGDLVCYLCDDDVLFKTAFSTFSQWMERNEDWDAVYGSEEVAIYEHGKEPIVIAHRKALEICGYGAYPLDCRVDYLQLCHRTTLLDSFTDEEYWPEGKETETHADGVFMEKIGKLGYIYPIPVKIGQNRRTPLSTYNPSK